MYQLVSVIVFFFFLSIKIKNCPYISMISTPIESCEQPYVEPNVTVVQPGKAPGIFRRGADSKEEGAKICFSGYYKCLLKNFSNVVTKPC